MKKFDYLEILPQKNLRHYPPMTIEIQAIQAFSDNYIWLLKDTLKRKAICIDPGDASPVLQVLDQEQLQLTDILITHHHWDHTDGISSLLNHFKANVYCKNNSSIKACTHPLVDGDAVTLKTLDMTFKVLETPGHTLDHICYYGNNRLFCGDTLFAAGCGRVFEGTAKQMFESLRLLASLPESTEVYCAHEYTLKNLEFALQLEPNNNDIKERLTQTQKLRLQGQKTLPSTIFLEKATNPFLRCHLPAIQKAASSYLGKPLASPLETFTVIREWKNQF